MGRKKTDIQPKKFMLDALQKISSYATQNPIPALSSNDLQVFVKYLYPLNEYPKKRDITIQSIFYYLALLFEQSIAYYYEQNDIDNLFPLGDLLLHVENIFPNEHNQLAMRHYACNVIMLNLNMVNNELAKPNWASLGTIRNELEILKSHSLRIGFNECIPSIEASENNLNRLEMVYNARVKFFSTNPSLYPKQVVSLSTKPTPIRRIEPLSAFNFFNLNTSAISDDKNNGPKLGR